MGKFPKPVKIALVLIFAVFALTSLRAVLVPLVLIIGVSWYFVFRHPEKRQKIYGLVENILKFSSLKFRALIGKDNRTALAIAIGAIAIVLAIVFSNNLQNASNQNDQEFQLKLKQYEASAQHYQKAHRLVSDPNTLLSRIIALQVAGKHAIALKDIESLLPKDDVLPQVHYHHGQSLDKVGLTYEASLAFVRFLKRAEGASNQRKRIARAESWLRAYNRSLTVPKDLQQRLEQPPSK